MENPDEKFAIYAEADDYKKPLIVMNLTFALLMDDVVVPYKAGEPFFIDGAPLTLDKIKKLKKSEDGTKLYLLKSESSPISLLYYESEDSHLEKVN